MDKRIQERLVLSSRLLVVAALLSAGVPSYAESPCDHVEAREHLLSLRARLARAQCAVGERRYTDAAHLLEPLVAEDPDDARFHLLLGIVRYHQGDLAGAERSLRQAAEGQPRNATAELYRGLVLLARGDPSAALTHFGRARTAEALEPQASYAEGIAELQLGNRDAARNAFERVETIDTDGTWSTAAAAQLAAMADPDRASSTADDIRAAPPSPWRVALTTGFEYDDNVVFRADDVVLPDDIANERDIRGLWSVRMGREICSSEDWSCGLRVTDAGTAHRDLTAFNAHLLGGDGWLSRRLGERLRAGLSYSYAHIWLDGRSVLDSHYVLPSLSMRWGRLDSTRALATIYHYDYRDSTADVPDGPGIAFAPCLSAVDAVCGPPGIDESRDRDRDGVGTTIGVEHLHVSEKLRSELRAGYAFTRYAAVGREQSYRQSVLRLGLLIRLPLELRVSAGASCAWRSFDHASTVPDPTEVVLSVEYPTGDSRRRDLFVVWNVGVERTLSEHVRLSFSYSSSSNASNYDAFDYNRQVVGTYLTLTLGSGP